MRVVLASAIAFGGAVFCVATHRYSASTIPDTPTLGGYPDIPAPKWRHSILFDIAFMAVPFYCLAWLLLVTRTRLLACVPSLVGVVALTIFVYCADVQAERSTGSLVYGWSLLAGVPIALAPLLWDDLQQAAARTVQRIRGRRPPG